MRQQNDGVPDMRQRRALVAGVQATVPGVRYHHPLLRGQLMECGCGCWHVRWRRTYAPGLRVCYVGGVWEVRVDGELQCCAASRHAALQGYLTGGRECHGHRTIADY